MKSCTLAVCTAAILTAGCQDERQKAQSLSPHAGPSAASSKKAESIPAPGPSGAPAAASAPTPATDLPPDVLVKVNDRALRLDDAVKEVDIIAAATRGAASPQQLEQHRALAFKAVVQQFIANSLLTDEADRIGITLTPADEARAASELQAMLPPGVSVEQVVRKSPIGEARFRDEMLRAAKIKKLLRSGDIPETTITDADFAAFTNQFHSRIEMSASARARHILIATKPSDGEAEREKKRQLAGSLRTQILDGADFAALAKAHSDCPSKENGGDLGRFGRGKMVKPFADAAFSQPIKAIGGVVETQYGYHIIQVIERSIMGRDEIMEEIRRQRILERLSKTAKIRVNWPVQPGQGSPAPNGSLPGSSRDKHPR